MSRDRAASLRARLLNVAKATGTDFNLGLVRFALERLLYRLSTSAHADRFVLKGALLFTLWYDLPHRATRNADLLGVGPSDTASMAGVFTDIAAMAGSDAGDDAIVFDPASVRVEVIRKDAGYGGVRVTLNSQLANARCVAQVDVGFGDAVTPGPSDAVYPVLLDDLPAPHLRTYPVYTVIAEKLRAVVVLGMVNSRLKDYLDLVVMLEREALDAATLALAIAATFQRRGTGLPAAVPVGLSDEFANDATRAHGAVACALEKECHRPPAFDGSGGGHPRSSLASPAAGQATPAMTGDGGSGSGADLRAENARLVALRVSHGIEWRKPAEVDVQPAASALSTDQKVALFHRLFLGRTDVYPVRWESKAGKTGYAPACANERRVGRTLESAKSPGSSAPTVASAV